MGIRIQIQNERTLGPKVLSRKNPIVTQFLVQSYFIELLGESKSFVAKSSIANAKEKTRRLMQSKTRLKTEVFWTLLSIARCLHTASAVRRYYISLSLDSRSSKLNDEGSLQPPISSDRIHRIIDITLRRQQTSAAAFFSGCHVDSTNILIEMQTKGITFKANTNQGYVIKQRYFNSFEIL